MTRTRTLILLSLTLTGCVVDDPLTARAERGDLEAQADLGSKYCSGDGVQRDPVEAVKWFGRAAEGGLPRAQFYLASMIGAGIGAPKDLELAARWLLKAAGNGLPQAQFHLGLMYAEGIGVDRDLQEARRWMRLAESSGVVEATAWLPDLGRPLAPAERRASRRFGELLHASEHQLLEPEAP